MNQVKIGSFIKKLRKEKELTQEQLAEQFGVSRRTVSSFDNCWVELKFTDGSMIAIDTIAVENEVARNRYEREFCVCGRIFYIFVL